ncbi:MAG: hypothetical protein M3406_09780 [Chloroflexota bacterium]|nr:hypothetical protein [Chloroflexota bacterium]
MSVVLLGVTAAFFFFALRLHRQLDVWYREDASRLWQARPWRWTVPVGGLGIAIMGLALLGASMRLIEPWAFLGACITVAGWSFVLGTPALSPTRHALDEVRRKPLEHPVPPTARADQPRVALVILGGLGAFLALVIGFLVWFATDI